MYNSTCLRVIDIGSHLRRRPARADVRGPGCPWSVGIGILGVVIGVEQGATMFGAPAALRCPSPLARRPRAGLRWLLATPFGRGTSERWVRCSENALWGTCGAEVELALLANEGPRP